MKTMYEKEVVRSYGTKKSKGQRLFSSIFLDLINKIQIQIDHF